MAILFNVTDMDRSQNISASLLENWTPIGAVAPELPGTVSPFISSFEIQAHLTIRQTARALELIRRCWGWYLNNPDGTQSTVIEGYLANGSFAYRYDRGYNNNPSYVSHSHGWSSGPTSALTEYILGLSVTTRAGQTWSLAPQFGDLKWTEGGFTTTLGKFRASWKTDAGGYTITMNTPEATSGIVALPAVGGQAKAVVIDGVAKGTISNSPLIVNFVGGSHTIVVS
jgi:Bacterial alpha-L-rhamnosidase C-terminal domain